MVGPQPTVRQLAMDLEIRLTHRVDPEAAGECARMAEALGARSLWSAEASCDPFLPLVAVAGASRRLELGTAIAVAFGRSPYVTAQSAWYLHRISGGRMVLGLGTQVKAHIERRFGMSWPGAGHALAEYIDCVREIWRSWRDGDSPKFEGQHWRATLGSPEFTPAPLPEGAGPIPVWIASVGPTLLRIAARTADGVHFHAFTTAQYLRDTLHPAIAQSRAEAGVSTPFRSACCVLAGVVHDDEQHQALRAHFRGIIAFYGSTPTYQPVLDSVGFGDLMPRLRELSRTKAWSAMSALIPDDLLDEMVLLDSPAELGRKLQAHYGGVLDQISLFRGGDRFMDPSDWHALADSLKTGANAS